MTSYYLVANDAVSFLMYAINNVMTYVIYANSPPITTLYVISGGGIYGKRFMGIPKPSVSDRQSWRIGE